MESGERSRIRNTKRGENKGGKTVGMPCIPLGPRGTQTPIPYIKGMNGSVTEISTKEKFFVLLMIFRLFLMT